MANSPMKSLAFVVLSLGAAGLLPAQQATFVVPPDYTAAEAPGSTGFGWGQGTTQRRVQWIYDSSYFTNNGVDHPIRITRLRWRANGASTVAAGTYSNATLQLASAAVDCLAPSTTFASNLGPDLATVYAGPVSIAAGQGQTPNNYFVDITLQTPFLYNPTLGADLVTDITVPASALTGSTPIHDAAFNASATPPLNILGGRVQSTNATATTGTTLAGGLVVLEVGYDYPPGVAYGQKYGQGCYDRALTWYEQFANGAFDLSNTSVRMTYTGGGYVVTPGFGSWAAPVAAPLTMGDDTISPPQTLPFAFPYPGGTTTALQICSNGYVLPQATAATTGQFAPTVAALLAGAARFAPAWSDWNPAAGGTVHFDVAPSGQSAIVTWNGVPEFQQMTANTFQAEFDAQGNVEYRYLTVANVARQLQVGWTQGAPARDPGNRDLTTAMPFVAETDTLALSLGLTGRPRLGTTCSLVSSNHVGAGSPPTLGLTALSLSGFPLGIPLDLIGLPGCFQYAGLDYLEAYLVVQPTAAINFPVPNVPSLAGLHVYSQAFSFANGVNAFGAIASNGVDLLVDGL
jgi:hypothetical protein